MRQQFRGRGGQSFRRGGQRGGFKQRNARPNNNQQEFKRGRGRGQGGRGRNQQRNQRPQNQQRRPQGKQRQGQQQDNIRRRGGFKNLRKTGRKGRIAGIDRETLEVAKQITSILLFFIYFFCISKNKKDWKQVLISIGRRLKKVILQFQLTETQ